MRLSHFLPDGLCRAASRRAAAWLLAGLAAAGAAPGQTPATKPPEEPAPPPRLELLAYTLQHRPAGEAIELIYPLLSERGSVEVQRAGNTLAIRDAPAVLAAVSALLQDFDHPPRPVRLQVRIVRASAEGVPGEIPPPEAGPAPAERALPPDLERRLRELLRYEGFRLMAAAELESREGEAVLYRVGADFEIRFTTGTLLGGRRLRLEGFQLRRRSAGPGAAPLLHTHLNLWLDRPMILGLARAESSPQALMLVLTCRLADAVTP